MDWFAEKLSRIKKSLENGEYPFFEIFRSSDPPEVVVDSSEKTERLIREVNENLRQAGRNAGLPILNFSSSPLGSLGKKATNVRLRLLGPFNKKETYERLIEELGTWRVTNLDAPNSVKDFYPYLLALLGNVSRIYRKGKASGLVKINISGKPISFNAEFAEPAEPRFYYFSNEKFTSRTIQYLSNLEGIGAMEGVLGGTNQVLFLLSILQQKNQDIKATFCDINPSQIVFASLLFVGYNKVVKALGHPEVFSFSFESKDAALDLLLGMGSESLIEGNVKPRSVLEGYKLGEIKINLINKNIEERIKEIKEDGVYFIYLSNTYPFIAYVKEKGILAKIDSKYNKTGAFARFLKAVCENSHILPSSRIMLQAPHDPHTIILEKREENNKPVLRVDFVEGMVILREAGQSAESTRGIERQALVLKSKARRIKLLQNMFAHKNEGLGGKG